MIAACDTFRAGAVEQLRTHSRKLNALHPPERHGGQTMVQLYEKGYGKDSSGVAMEAIAHGNYIFRAIIMHIIFMIHNILCSSMNLFR